MPRKKSKKTSKKKNSGFVNNYIKQRDQFFNDHPNARIFIGIFLVAVAILVASQIFNYKAHQFAGEVLGAQGINYNPNW